MVAADAGVRRMPLFLVSEVLVCVVHYQPDIVLCTNSAQAAQVVSRHRNPRRIAGVDYSDHLDARACTRLCQLILQPGCIREEVFINRAEHHAIAAASHLDGHEVIEVVWRKEHR
eukprot:CAMPEP_0115310042 /NCGR_PEP_ID=MMETSP0270-20121206/74583_1 /TAXON_ID=71861 /ORGANISM="Scrippsiella trochoidea, Strain CCMP3099" /LENGTH=114 /DNA_ID=CAMNT_0002728765 /DNA_START=83 /DNA_END=424 /DNA_ORIENTATION=+